MRYLCEHKPLYRINYMKRSQRYVCIRFVLLYEKLKSNFILKFHHINSVIRLFSSNFDVQLLYIVKVPIYSK